MPKTPGSKLAVPVLGVAFPNKVPPVYIADPVCAVVKYTNEIALAPVKVVFTDNAVGLPPKHKV